MTWVPTEAQVSLTQAQALAAEQSASTRNPVARSRILRAASVTGSGVYEPASTLADHLRQVGQTPEQRREGPLLQQLAQDALLAALEGAQLTDAVRRGALDLLRCEQDRLLPGEDRLLVIREGQVALAAFEPAARKAEIEAQRGGPAAISRRRKDAGPLIHLPGQHLAWFVSGDVISLSALSRRFHRAAEELSLFSLTPVRLLSIAERELHTFARSGLPETLRAAEQVLSLRLDQERTTGAAVIDGYIRHGLTLAKSVRVVDLEQCTFCRDCERACADRYGQKRLQLDGVHIGAMLFPLTCRTCSHQRCIEVCPTGAIRFHGSPGEVLINEEQCIGCSFCAEACPYDAISTLEAAADPLRSLMQARIERERAPEIAQLEALLQKEGDPKKQERARAALLTLKKPYERPRDRPWVASKCDHCTTDYGGQKACVSACTKGAMFDLSPAELFFHKGLQTVSADHDRAQVRRPRPSAAWVAIPLSAAGLLLSYLIHRGNWMGLSYLNNQVYYRVLLGALGTALMGWAVAYALFNRLLKSARGPLRWLFGSLSGHGWSGFLSLLFIIYHAQQSSGLDGRTWQGIAAWLSFWLLGFAVLLGIGARSFASGIVGLSHRAAAEQQLVIQEINALRQKLGGVGDVDQIYEDAVLPFKDLAEEARRTGRQRGADLGNQRMGLALQGLVALLRDDLLSHPRRARRLRLRLTKVHDPRAAARLARLLSRRVRLTRQELLVPLLRPLFSGLRLIHISLSVLLLVVLAVHIYAYVKLY